MLNLLLAAYIVAAYGVGFWALAKYRPRMSFNGWVRFSLMPAWIAMRGAGFVAGQVIWPFLLGVSDARRN